MCTLTHLPRPAADDTWLCRLAFNRDELLTRGPETPPMLRCAGTLAALWPLDSVSGGTWIGVNERGLAAFLLNGNPSDPTHPTPTHSRGELIPVAMAATDLASAEASMRATTLAGVYPWYRLVLVDGESACVLHHLPGGLQRENLATDAPWILTSSSLGDDIVTPPRAALFADMLLGDDVPAGARQAAQRDFHAHRWPDRPELSVNMRRHDADTRSYCEIDLHVDRVCLRYQFAPPPLQSADVAWTLPRVKD